MSRARKDLGEWGEAAAAQHLLEQGCQILQRNWRCDVGEMDIVAQDGETLVFVEVKSFDEALPGSDPAENVHRHKQQRIARCAQVYLARLGREPYCRFDVITVIKEPSLKLQHHKGAFTL